MTKILLVLFLLVMGCASTPDQDVPEWGNRTCPVMRGGEIIKEIYTIHKGKKIYFCCKPCIKEFKKDPAKYEKIMLEDMAKPSPKTEMEK